MRSLSAAISVGVVVLFAAVATGQDVAPSCTMCPGTYIPNSEIEAYVARAKANS